MDRRARRPAARRSRRTARPRRRSRTLERHADAKEKTGVFIGAYATNPVTGGQIPIFIADYVLAGYGTGAIMAVPGQDERDWAFAEVFDLPIVRTVQPPEGFDGKAYTGDGPAINSAAPERGIDLDGLGVAEAKAKIIDWLEANGHGAGAVTYRLRDWLFSRQRYWGEPFPIVYDETGAPIALPEEMLPVELPEVDDFSPKTFDPDDADSEPETPLSRRQRLGRGRAGPGRRAQALHPRDQRDAAVGRLLLVRAALPGPDQLRRGSSTRPTSGTGWARSSAGDCGGTDLYVGGAEHAVLHLLYARFWHKVLYDLGHVSSLRAVPPAVQPGHDPGVRVHRRRAAPTCRPRRSSSATARTSWATARSTASTARWASR